MGEASDDRSRGSAEDPARVAQQREVRRLRRVRKQARQRGWEFFRRPDGTRVLLDPVRGTVIATGHTSADFKRVLRAEPPRQEAETGPPNRDRSQEARNDARAGDDARVCDDDE
jgi:hypothetical protein